MGGSIKFSRGWRGSIKCLHVAFRSFSLYSKCSSYVHFPDIRSFVFLCSFYIQIGLGLKLYTDLNPV